ncbi:MAG TPA: hypothetical protein VFY23_16220 [Candidatus Limnocylindrales bacterium]|nr:hypothetical protein [Candidatus Limnocylindrales bacterium]
MRRTLITALAGLLLAAGIAACGSDADVDVDVEAPPLESPLATEETEVGGGASPSPEASVAP